MYKHLATLHPTYHYCQPVRRT